MFYRYINNCTVFRLLGSLFPSRYIIVLIWIYTAQNTKFQTLFNSRLAKSSSSNQKTVFYFALANTSSCKPINKHLLTIYQQTVDELFCYKSFNLSLSKLPLLPVWTLMSGVQVPKTGLPGHLGYSWNQGGYKGGPGRKTLFVKIVENIYMPLYLQ